MPIDFCCKMWYNRSRKTGRRRVRGECRLWLAYANSANIRSLNILTNSSPANICLLSICELRQSVSCGELWTVASCELEVKGWAVSSELRAVNYSRRVGWLSRAALCASCVWKNLRRESQNLLCKKTLFYGVCQASCKVQWAAPRGSLLFSYTMV